VGEAGGGGSTTVGDCARSDEALPSREGEGEPANFAQPAQIYTGVQRELN